MIFLPATLTATSGCRAFQFFPSSPRLCFPNRIKQQSLPLSSPPSIPAFFCMIPPPPPPPPPQPNLICLLPPSLHTLRRRRRRGQLDPLRPSSFLFEDTPGSGKYQEKEGGREGGSRILACRRRRRRRRRPARFFFPPSSSNSHYCTAATERSHRPTRESRANFIIDQLDQAIIHKERRRKKGYAIRRKV